MGKTPDIQNIDNAACKQDIPEFGIGDTLRVQVRIVDEGGKERLQAFMGTVIARHGSGISETVTLHRIAYGEGMERVLFIHSPLIGKIEVVRFGQVRRAKLNYLRGTSGKASKVKGRFVRRAAAQAVETAQEVESTQNAAAN